MPELKTEIREVTVFTDRARLTRVGSIEVEKGEQKIEFPELPLTIEPESVRAAAQGTARARLLGIDVQKSFFKETPAATVRELTEKLLDLEDRDRGLADEIESVNAQIKHLDGLATSTDTYAKSLGRGFTNLEKHGALIDFITQRRIQAQEKNREIAVKRRELDREIKKTRNELQRLQKARPAQRYTAIVDLDVLEPGELEIQLVYMQRGTGWRPLYDIRLREGKLEVSYLAQVTQNSGEDWEDVAVTLSTARPSHTAIVPKVNPWYISIFTPPPPRKERMMYAQATAMAGAAPPPAAAPAPMEDLSMALEEAEAEPIMDVEIATAEVGGSGPSVTYSISGTTDIPGDGSPKKTTIAIFTLDPEFDYVTVPEMDPAAYRRVSAVNESPYLLLTGTAQVFEGEDYIGRTNLKLISPKEKIKLYFGTDERIRIKRELVQRETDKKFMADKRRIRYGYEIELENHTEEEQNITVKDRIPVTRNEQIKVRFEDDEPGVTEKDKLNRLDWDLHLPVGKKTVIQYGFSVEFPQSLQVTGLP